jgi:hypothetical protein
MFKTTDYGHKDEIMLREYYEMIYVSIGQIVTPSSKKYRRSPHWCQRPVQEITLKSQPDEYL